MIPKDKHIGDLNMLLSLLNSKLLNFFYSEISQEKGRTLAEVKPTRLKQLPINISSSTRKTKAIIEEKVQIIIKRKKENPEADVNTLESEIDQLVYGLYDLTKDEIRIVENSFS